MQERRGQTAHGSQGSMETSRGKEAKLCQEPGRTTGNELKGINEGVREKSSELEC